jgi:uncharacterized protein with HEPN domain
MSRSIVARLRDIVYSADLTAQHAGDLSASALAASDTKRDAALFRIAVIGEAAAHLPAEVQTLAPEIPWSRVKNMRNHVIHGYWQVDFSAVVETVALDLDPLKTAANRLIELIERADT